jgi:hypothetical protein
MTMLTLFFPHEVCILMVCLKDLYLDRFYFYISIMLMASRYTCRILIHTTLYADDTTINSALSTVEKFRTEKDIHLFKTQYWFVSNRFSLNKNKIIRHIHVKK